MVRSDSFVILDSVQETFVNITELAKRSILIQCYKLAVGLVLGLLFCFQTSYSVLVPRQAQPGPGVLTRVRDQSLCKEFQFQSRVKMSQTGDTGETLPQYKFVTASTQIKSKEQVITWEESEAYQEYVGFILAVGDTIKGKKLKDAGEPSEACQRLLDLLSSLRSVLSPVLSTDGGQS